MKSLLAFIALAVALLVPSFEPSAQQSDSDLHKKVVGCYSAGDRGVTVMRITKNFIQTRHGKQRIPYSVLEVNRISNTILFELLEKDRSNYLQRFVAIIYVADDEVVKRDFDSIDDYRNNNPSGWLTFARDKCSVVASFLK